MPYRRNKGFTVIEMMIVVAIIAVLAAIAYPSYTRYGFRARRAEGKELLLRLAAAQEKYYGSCNRYAANIAPATATLCDGNLGINSSTSTRGYYSVVVTDLGANNQTFTMTASPVAGTPQATDVCGGLRINNQSFKDFLGVETNGSCW